MIARFLNWFLGDINPRQVDAVLYVCVGVFVFQQGYLSSEDAYKYMDPYLLFFAKFLVGSLAAGAGALKMSRSGQSATQADMQEKKTT